MEGGPYRKLVILPKGAPALSYLYLTTILIRQSDKLMKPDQLETDKQDNCEQ